MADAHRRAARVLATLALLAAATSDAQAQTLTARIIAAEDARVSTGAGIAPLLEALRLPQQGPFPSPDISRAVRGLGRFERPAFVEHLLPLLSSPVIPVRSEAANALAQSVVRLPRSGPPPVPAELTRVTRALLEALPRERNSDAAGVIAESLGRLPYREAAVVREVEQAIARRLPIADDGAAVMDSVALIGMSPRVVKGLESLIRLNLKLQPPAPSTVARLRRLALLGNDPRATLLTPVRRLAWMALNVLATAGISVAPPAEHADLMRRGYQDPDAQVRRLVTVAAGAPGAADDLRRDVLRRALADPSFHVRFEAVRVYGRTLRASDCAPLLVAVGDRDRHVSLGAIDAMAAGCADPRALPLLTAFVDGVAPTGTASWHSAAHALVTLARLSKDAAAERVRRVGAHPTWQLRMYAARAAAALGDGVTLRQLAGDGNDNVRHEALLGLRQVSGRAADDVYVGALARADYQLLLAAAQALEGTPNRAAAVPSLLDAFRRVSEEGRDTSRDTRMALLARLRELGSSGNAASLQPCLGDRDEVVAAECAAVVEAWTGSRPPVRPAPAAPEPVPEPLPTTARVVMAGGVFELRLFPEETPATVARFARLAREGYYDGLTFHRVAPNFVLQGGSPGANEYAGDGPFMRDELGPRSHARGTLGISTRGRDTGDAQIFVNLLDNPRLDHDFTVFAEITSGMAVVDAIVEGDVIERVEVE